MPTQARQARVSETTRVGPIAKSENTCLTKKEVAKTCLPQTAAKWVSRLSDANQIFQQFRRKEIEISFQNIPIFKC